jgi:hypothetical protein
VLLRAIVVGCVALSALADVTDRRSYTVTLTPPRALSVELTIGHVRIHGEPRADAVLEVVRTAPTRDALARIPVTVDESPTEVRVVGLQAGGGTDAALKTDVTLRVPRDAVIDSVRVVEGQISLAGLAGRISADVRRGPIEANDVQGVVRLETGIGNVVARGMRLAPGGLLRLRAFNGDIRLTLAERPANARVMALALNGTVQSQIPLTVKDTWGPRWGEATIGSGEPVISLDVITGKIAIAIE